MELIKRYQIRGVSGEVSRVQMHGRIVDYWIPKTTTGHLLIAHDGQNVFDGKTSTHRRSTWEMAQSAIRVSEQLEIANLLMKGEQIPFTSFHDPVSLKRPRKVSPWWWTDKDGKYLMAIKYGSKVIELAKGKSAVQAETLEQIIEVLKSLKLATSNGELDLHLTQASELIRKKFKVKKVN